MNRIALTVAVTIATGSSLAHGQSQPMAVAPTSFNVTSGRPGHVQAICLKAELDIPNVQDRLTPVYGEVYVTTTQDGVSITVPFQESGILVHGDGSFGLAFYAPSSAPPDMVYEIDIRDPVYFADGHFISGDLNEQFRKATDDFQDMTMLAAHAESISYLPLPVNDMMQFATWEAEAAGDYEQVDEFFVQYLREVRAIHREALTQLSIMGMSPQEIAEILILLNGGERLTTVQTAQARRDGVEILVPDPGQESKAFQTAIAAARGGGAGGPGGPGEPGEPGGPGGGDRGNGGETPHPQAQPFDTDGAFRAYVAACTADGEEEEQVDRLGQTR